MPIGVALPDNVTQFPTDVATNAEREKLANLGQQINQIVHDFNALKQELAVDGREDRKAKFAALLAQRKAAIEAAMLAWKAKETQIGTGTQVAALAGRMGAIDLTSIQTQITTEQTKLTALQTYYAAYRAAVDAGQQPPPMPPELETGFMGFSGTTLMLIVGGIAAALFFFSKK